MGEEGDTYTKGGCVSRNRRPLPSRRAIIMSILLVSICMCLYSVVKHIPCRSMVSLTSDR